MSFESDRSLLFVPPSTQDRIKGVLNAIVVLVMYGDYQSQESANVDRLIKVIGRQLSVSLGENYLCFIFRHFPQIQIHPHAQRAAQAAEAAAAQGQFWQMHEMLFIYQQELGNGYLVEYANRLGLDISQFLQDLSRGRYVNRINADIEGGLRSGVEAAPALFINGIRYLDRWTVEQIMAAIVAAND
ncbi:MAG: thioredoxin domain-containing protein [Nostoc sp. DedQUE08]|uniref:DsbA family protein n=1 Tax=unclassified Nostoc TaxID=2593658 RepID=UPI002AD41319|nr:MULTISPECIES: thioredoxin domain-containing protein [unclassified Nostoc]MDZ8065237.1 thioredoxin domain-containing protein [Nostoc sp. DedQUE08]MDZ8132103.1 thioredoxin domain-containing protein [Nostoc sp. DedQUE07]